MSVKSIAIHDLYGNLVEERIEPENDVKRYRTEITLKKILIDQDVYVNIIPTFVESEIDMFNQFFLN